MTKRRRSWRGNGHWIFLRSTYGRWWGLLAGIIAAGLLSRVVHTGFAVFDKYLGDALYAAMVYALLRLSGRVERVALWAAVAMVGIELFQLTGLAAGWVRSEWLVVRVCARLLGTQFGVWDLVAYGVGIAVMRMGDEAGPG
ncbi:MAG: DUF2809 domain-containing protein [Acidobacteria bacterium]|nr:DUF2809 domain-containing protein [Acidobacteriota bacterium]